MLGLLTCACGKQVSAGSNEQRPASVLLVAIDGLRVDQMGVYRGSGGVTPCLDALARRGLRYTDVETPTPWTSPALAGLLTGRYPSAIGWTDLEHPLPYEATLLAERLRERGYTTAAVVNSRHACARLGFDQGFQTFDEVGVPPEEATDDDVFPPSTQAVTDTALSRLEEVGPKPFFLFVHYAGPLPPWPVGEERIDADYDGPVHAGLSLRELLALTSRLRAEDRRALAALHDAAVAEVDHAVGRLLAGLEARGRGGETYVAVVATSGLELADHGELGTAKRLYDELVYVPWILTGPGLEPAVLEDAASLIDVTPTLLELLGEKPLPRADGVAVLPELAPPERILVSETDRARSLRAVTLGRWKLIHDRETGRSELYNLYDDPKEQEDLARSRPNKVAELEARLAEWEASCGAH